MRPSKEVKSVCIVTGCSYQKFGTSVVSANGAASGFGKPCTKAEDRVCSYLVLLLLLLLPFVPKCFMCVPRSCSSHVSAPNCWGPGGCLRLVQCPTPSAVDRGKDALGPDSARTFSRSYLFAELIDQCIHFGKKRGCFSEATITLYWPIDGLSGTIMP